MAVNDTSNHQLSTPCPSCGYCPTCGRRNGYGTIYPQPYTPPYIWYADTDTSGSTTSTQVPNGVYS